MWLLVAPEAFWVLKPRLTLTTIMRVCHHACSQVRVALQRRPHHGRPQAIDNATELMPAAVEAGPTAELQMQKYARLRIRVERLEHMLEVCQPATVVQEAPSLASNNKRNDRTHGMMLRAARHTDGAYWGATVLR